MRTVKDIIGNQYGVWRVVARNAKGTSYIDCVCKMCNHAKTFTYSNLTRTPSSCPSCGAKSLAIKVEPIAREITVIQVGNAVLHIGINQSPKEALSKLDLSTLSEAVANKTIRCWGCTNGKTFEYGVDWALVKQNLAATQDGFLQAASEAIGEPEPALPAHATTLPQDVTYAPLEENHWRIKKADMAFLSDPHSEAIADLPCPGYLMSLIEQLDHPRFLELEWRFSPASETEVFAYWSEPVKKHITAPDLLQDNYGLD